MAKMKISTGRCLFFLMFVGVIALAFTSCKDKEDEPGKDAKSLVGTWYFTGDVEIDYQDFFIFKSNGKVEYTYYDEGCSGEYIYTPLNGSLNIIWDDLEWGIESLTVSFESDKVIWIEGGQGHYGRYTRK